MPHMGTAGAAPSSILCPLAPTSCACNTDSAGYRGALMREVDIPRDRAVLVADVYMILLPGHGAVSDFSIAGRL